MFRFDPNSTQREGRWRLIAPGRFKAGTLRREYHWQAAKGSGVSFVVGELIRGGRAVQSVRFDRDRVTEEDATAWWGEFGSAFNREWTERDWERIEDAELAGQVARLVTFAEGGDAQETVETAFTPTNVLSWIDKTSSDRVDAIVGSYLDRWRGTALSEFAAGTAPGQLAQKMMEADPDLSQIAADRQARTLTTAVYNYSKMEQYAQDSNVTGFLFVAVMDDVTSDICINLNGMQFGVDEIDEFTPPLHYNCRSAIRPITIYDSPDVTDEYITSDEMRETDVYKDVVAPLLEENSDFRTPEGFVQFSDRNYADPGAVTLTEEGSSMFGDVMAEHVSSLVGDMEMSDVTDMADMTREFSKPGLDKLDALDKLLTMMDRIEQAGIDPAKAGDVSRSLVNSWDTFYSSSEYAKIPTAETTPMPVEPVATPIETPIETPVPTEEPVAPKADVIEPQPPTPEEPVAPLHPATAEPAGITLDEAYAALNTMKTEQPVEPLDDLIATLQNMMAEQKAASDAAKDALVKSAEQAGTEPPPEAIAPEPAPPTPARTAEIMRAIREEHVIPVVNRRGDTIMVAVDGDTMARAQSKPRMEADAAMEAGEKWRAGLSEENKTALQHWIVTDYEVMRRLQESGAVTPEEAARALGIPPLSADMPMQEQRMVESKSRTAAYLLKQVRAVEAMIRDSANVAEGAIYRGFPSDDIGAIQRQLKSSGMMVTKSMASFSTEGYVAEGFAARMRLKYKVVVHVEDNYSAVAIGNVGEGEVMHRQGTVFKVKDMKVDRNTLHITAQEVRAGDMPGELPHDIFALSADI